VFPHEATSLVQPTRAVLSSMAVIRGPCVYGDLIPNLDRIAPQMAVQLLAVKEDESPVATSSFETQPKLVVFGKEL
jgi:hypothetical protein